MKPKTYHKSNLKMKFPNLLSLESAIIFQCSVMKPKTYDKSNLKNEVSKFVKFRRKKIIYTISDRANRLCEQPLYQENLFKMKMTLNKIWRHNNSLKRMLGTVRH